MFTDMRRSLSQIADHPLVRKERLPKRHALSYLKYHFRFAEKALSETELREAFVDGHLGTATLWSFIFKRFPYLELVHFDSDVLFFGEIVETIALSLRKERSCWAGTSLQEQPVPS